jgi:hypothetical protein
VHYFKVAVLISLVRCYNVLAGRRINFVYNVVLLESKATDAIDRACRIVEVLD